MGFDFRSAWIRTATGRRVYPLEMTPGQIDPRDIAHALAQKARFSGHCPEFYSVAQHSVLVSRHNPGHAAWGLLHDAAEAYLPDLPRPIKRAFCVRTPPGFVGGPGDVIDFRAVEEQILRAVADRFGIIYPPPSSVRKFDSRALALERDTFFGGADLGQPLPDPLPGPLVAMPWKEARDEWLARFEELFGAIVE